MSIEKFKTLLNVRFCNMSDRAIVEFLSEGFQVIDNEAFYGLQDVKEIIFTCVNQGVDVTKIGVLISSPSQYFQLKDFFVLYETATFLEKGMIFDERTEEGIKSVEALYHKLLIERFTPNILERRINKILLNLTGYSITSGQIKEVKEKGFCIHESSFLYASTNIYDVEKYCKENNININEVVLLLHSVAQLVVFKDKFFIMDSDQFNKGNFTVWGPRVIK